MKKFLVLLASLLLFCVGNAFAFPMWPGYTNAAGTLYEDNDLDFFTDNDGNGLITEGDVLTAVVEFSKAIHLNQFGLGIGSVDLNEGADDLVAISQLKVLTVNSNGSMIMGQIDDTTAMVQFYTGGSNLDVLTSDPTLAQAVAAATDGTHLWDFSITDDVDTFWLFVPIASGANDPSVVAGLSAVNKVGVVNYALNQVWGDDIFNSIYNPLNVVDDGLVDLVGSGDILGGAGLSSAFARSDIDVSLNPIPEPATMSLLGLGLLGMAFVGRHRTRK